jgi:integrase
LHKYDNIEKLAALGCNSETNRILVKLAVSAGIEKKFTFHTARHTCATLLVHQGVPITTVQRLLGHTSVKTTQIYSEVMDETMIKDLMRANKKYNRGQLEIVKQNHEDSSSMDKKI